MTTATRRATATAPLAVAYVGAIVVANWASTRWPGLSIGPLVMPAGTLCTGCIFTLRDLLHNALGTRGVAAAITVGAALSWLLASSQIALASVLAFGTSELLDSAVYARLRARSRLRAVVVSNVAGLLVDSVLFVPLAFGSFAAVSGQVLGKSAGTAVTIVALLVRSRRVSR